MDIQQAHKVLKSIDMLTYDVPDQDKTPYNIDGEAEDNDYLLDTLGAGSKSFNNMDSQLKANFGGADKLVSFEVEKTISSHQKIGHMGSVKFTPEQEVQKLRALAHFSSEISGIKRPNQRFFDPKLGVKADEVSNIDEQVMTDTTNNVPVVEYMKYHTQLVFNLLNQKKRKKRESKLNEKIQEEKEAVQQHVNHQQEFNNDVFDNLKIEKKEHKNNCAPVTNGKNNYVENHNVMYGGMNGSYNNMQYDQLPKIPTYDNQMASYQQSF